MKTFPFGVQWVSGLSTDGEARGHLPNGQSWDEYLMNGANALNFDGKDRVRFDSSPPKELVAEGAGQAIWTVELTDGVGELWYVGPDSDGDGDPDDVGGWSCPLSQVPHAYRSSKGFCLCLKPDARNPYGRFTVKITLKVGDYIAEHDGKPFLLISWA